jgi:asparagine synthase (glutamine-hydrolysing)
MTDRCSYQAQPPVKSDYEDHTQLINRPLMHRILCSLDTAAAAFNIELRYPFFDKRLVEYCLALPPEQKLFNGWNRIILRRAMQGILPDKVQWRGSKSDLSYGFNHNLFQHAYHLLHPLIFEKPDIISPYLNVGQLRNLYNAFMENHGKPTNAGLTLYKSAMLSQWLQQAELY